MEIQNNQILIKKLKELNPKVTIYAWNNQLVPQEGVFISVPMEQLVLPEGFYYNEKNGITNKHNSETGMYLALDAKSLNDVLNNNETMACLYEVKAPQKKKNIEKIAGKAKYYEDNASLVKDVKKLNPKAKIYMWNRHVPQEGMFSNIPVDELVLPDGFYYNEKNGITNKHNTESGIYNTLSCKPLEDLDFSDDFIRYSVDEVKISTRAKMSVQKAKTIVQNMKEKVSAKVGLNTRGRTR